MLRCSIGLQRPSVDAIVGQLIAAGVAQHVRVRLDAKISYRPRPAKSGAGTNHDPGPCIPGHSQPIICGLRWHRLFTPQEPVWREPVPIIPRAKMSSAKTPASGLSASRVSKSPPNLSRTFFKTEISGCLLVRQVRQRIGAQKRRLTGQRRLAEPERFFRLEGIR
jgi:hypothetical protein